MSELERAKKYLNMIPDELRGNPNDLVQLLATMVAKVEEQDKVFTETFKLMQHHLMDSQQLQAKVEEAEELLTHVDALNMSKQAKIDELTAELNNHDYKLGKTVKALQATITGLTAECRCLEAECRRLKSPLCTR